MQIPFKVYMFYSFKAVPGENKLIKPEFPAFPIRIGNNFLSKMKPGIWRIR